MREISECKVAKGNSEERMGIINFSGYSLVFKLAFRAL